MARSNLVAAIIFINYQKSVGDPAPIPLGPAKGGASSSKDHSTDQEDKRDPKEEGHAQEGHAKEGPKEEGHAKDPKEGHAKEGHAQEKKGGLTSERSHSQAQLMLGYSLKLGPSQPVQSFSSSPVKDKLDAAAIVWAGAGNGEAKALDRKVPSARTLSATRFFDSAHQVHASSPSHVSEVGHTSALI